jgi:hypothetical protein
MFVLNSKTKKRFSPDWSTKGSTSMADDSPEINGSFARLLTAPCESPSLLEQKESLQL